MKKLLLSLATVALGLSANAGEVTFDFTLNSYGLPEYNEDLGNASPYVENGTSIELDGVKITFDGGNGKEEWRMWSDGLRSYASANSKSPNFTVTTTNGQNVTYVTWATSSAKGCAFAETAGGDAITAWYGNEEEVTFYNVGNANAAVKTITVGYGEVVDPEPQPETPEFNVVDALAWLNAGNSGTAIVYGVITSVESYNSTYGSITYYIGDTVDATATLQIYSGLGVKGEKFTSKNDLVVGSKVQIQGELKIYVNASGTAIPEMNQSSVILSLELPDDYVEPAKPEGVLTVAEAVNDWILQGYEGPAIVKGIITDIEEVSLQYGNATYTIKDSAEAEVSLIVYRGYSVDGAKFSSEDEINIGDVVEVEGNLVYYNNATPEFTNGSKIISLNGQSTGVSRIENNNAPVEYFNLQGVRVNNPSNGLYIIRQGNKVSKAIVR